MALHRTLSAVMLVSYFKPSSALELAINLLPRRTQGCHFRATSLDFSLTFPRLSCILIGFLVLPVTQISKVLSYVIKPFSAHLEQLDIACSLGIYWILVLRLDGVGDRCSWVLLHIFIGSWVYVVCM
jgi:hypothetical protein